jgi:DGQHR domain-containing protein
MPDLKKINSSWTKFDVVQVIEITADGKLSEVYNSRSGIDLPILKSFVGVNSLEEPLPNYWDRIRKYPKQLRLFALMATIFTHEKNIKDFANKYSEKNMRGVLVVPPGKHGTNLRRCLFISGATLQNYKKEKQVPYDLSALYEEGEVGTLFKEVLMQRLVKIGHKEDELDTLNKFLGVCYSYQFHKVLSLTRDQFKRWLNGKSLNQQVDIFNFSQLKIYQNIPMIKMNQWLNEWDDVIYSAEELRRKPEPRAYLFSIDARVLKKLSDVHRRKPDKPRSEDRHVQRNLNESRIEEINSYIEGGFPWSTLSMNEKLSYENQRLKMPGFLPTAIIANIIGPGEKRNNQTVNEKDLLKIDYKDKDTFATLKIPDAVFSDDWAPDLKPIEIIDGQHRLWAFDENEPLSGNFELPVVAYYNLDRAWQAYLFYTINIKPVKINTSLGYDLYPLLRTQEWLENSKEGLLAYRETRAQEIVEALWNYPESPWFKRINMIGESGGPTMSQAAFVRTLSNSFFKKKNGLYSSALPNNEVLPWSRTQQAAFIILLWTELAFNVKNVKSNWAIQLREEDRQLKIYEESKVWDLAFTSKNSFLSRDQGVRGFSSFANDFFYIAASYDDLQFNEFKYEEEDDKSISSENLTKAINYIKSEKEGIYSLIKQFGNIASNVDWRTPSANFENEDKRNKQMRFRGSGGYSQFWKVLYEEFQKSNSEIIKKYVSQLKL